MILEKENEGIVLEDLTLNENIFLGISENNEVCLINWKYNEMFYTILAKYRRQKRANEIKMEIENAYKKGKKVFELPLK